MPALKWTAVGFSLSLALTASGQAAPQGVLHKPPADLSSKHAQVQVNAPGSASQVRAGSVTPISTEGLKAERFKTDNGQVGWRVRIPGGRALATPAVVDGMVFVGGGFGSSEFYAFDAESGAPRWAVGVSDDGPTAAVVSEGRVVFNTESCTLFVLDAKTGKEIWSRWLGDPLMSQPAVHAGVVYMAYPGADGHQLIALGLHDGKERWSVPIAGDIISAPVVDGDSIYLSTNDGTVYRHKLSDGSLVWQKAMHATSAPWIAGDGVHVAQGEVAGKNRNEGYRTLAQDGSYRTGLQGGRSADWLDANVQSHSGYAAEQKADDSSVGFSSAPATAKVSEAQANLGQSNVRGLWEFQGSRPTVIGGTTYTTQGDRVRALDSDGVLVWEKKLAGDVRTVGGALGAPPSYAAGKLVVATAGGDLVTYDAKSGNELFRVPLKQEIRFQPALVKGTIFVGTASGELVAVSTGDESLDRWNMWGGGPRHNGPEAK